MIDLKGQRFGKLSVVDGPFRENGETFWTCICDCGNSIKARSNNLRRGRCNSCGCSRRDRWDVQFEKVFKGKKFGRLTPIKRVHCSQSKNNRPYIQCMCECGETTLVSGSALLNGSIKSCGCYNKDGTTKPSFAHGLSHTRLYKIWENMITRCENPNNASWKTYGGRGISICQEWRSSFQSFYDWAMTHGYSDDLTIDRINNDLGYCPDNCQFITRSENTKKMLQERRKNKAAV